MREAASLMKITGLKTFVVANPPPRRGGRYFVFLKLVTDNGIEGVGEVYNATFAPHVIVKMIEDVFQRNVEGVYMSQSTAFNRVQFKIRGQRGYGLQQYGI